MPTCTIRLRALDPRIARHLLLTLVTVGLAPLSPAMRDATAVHAQIPFEGEVRQLVTFRFLPGRSGEALQLYTEQAVPLYQADTAMRSFRGLREVESPIPLDLVVVSSFAGMAGMDDSNAELRRLAGQAGTSIGAIYGAIGALSSSHDDQFVAMLPELGNGDPATARLVTLVWYRTLAGEQEQFERSLVDVVEWETKNGIRASTGRFLVSAGWTHLRFLGFESLEEYQSYWDVVSRAGAHGYLDGVTAERREVILAPVPELTVR